MADFNMTDPMSKYQWDGQSPEGLTYDGVSPAGWSYDGGSPEGYSVTPSAPDGYADPKVAELRQWKDKLSPASLSPDASPLAALNQDPTGSLTNSPMPGMSPMSSPDAPPIGSGTSSALQSGLDQGLLRPDGTKKGMGFLGPLKMTDGSGRQASEISVGVNINGKEMDVPTLVPTLDKSEVDYLLGGGRPTSAIVQKAAAYAKQRISQGLSPFYEEGGSFQAGGSPLDALNQTGFPPSPDLSGMTGSQPQKKSIFGAPLERLAASMGVLANAMNPKDRPGDAAIGFYNAGQQQRLQEKHLGLEEKRLESGEELKKLVGEKNALSIQKMIDQERAKKAESTALVGMVGKNPGSPEWVKAAQDYVGAGGTNPEILKHLAGAGADKDAEAGKRTAFETLHPEWKGKVGTPEYAEAFKVQKEPALKVDPGHLIATINDPKSTPEQVALAKKNLLGQQDYAIKTTGSKAEATEKAKQVGGFTEWTPQAKQQAFVYNLITKEPPVSTRGMAAGDRKVYAKEYAQWQVDNGFKPADIALMQSDYRAGDMSLKNMSKQEAPMSAFVGNINKQIDKVEELYRKDDRIGIRLLDKPIRDLRVMAKGSGDEAVKASYLLEISNEIGKLSSGASGSVQQLSDSAKEDWKKVHDVNLSMGEIMKVVNATRDQANMRMASWRDAKEEVRSMIGSLGTQNQGPGPAAGGANNPGNIMKPGGEKSGRRDYGSPEEGLIAIPHLLNGDRYRGKTVDEAMKLYSNKGYGGELVPELKDKKISSLTAGEMTKLTRAIIKREGNTKAALPPGFKKGW